MTFQLQLLVCAGFAWRYIRRIDVPKAGLAGRSIARSALEKPSP
jgi:hypothetical protein